MLETMSFEFMLSRCSSAIPKAAPHCFELHSKVDVRHIGISKCGGISGSLATSSGLAISLTGAELCQLELRTPTAERRCTAGGR